jgi:DNA-binding NarL/FixJ family response regulator
MDDQTTSCVLLADRHHGLSEGIRGLLESIFSTVFMVTDEASLVEGARRLRPSVIVADLSLVPGDSLGFAQRLREQAGGAKLVLLSAHDEPAVARSAIAAGADGVILRRALSTDLLEGVDRVLRGESYVSPAMLGSMERQHDRWAK